MLTNALRRNELSPFNGRVPRPPLGAVVLPLQRRSEISARGVETVDRDRALWLQRNPSVDEFSFTVEISPSRRMQCPDINS
jgi:hypothetical protein